MDLRRSDYEGLKTLAEAWKKTPGAELEASLLGLDITSWQDVIQYLRSLGMSEAPQIVKLNISLSNDIRITLEGAGVIQAYCKDNRLADKPFVALLKENIADAPPVDIPFYGARAKLKREVPLAPDDLRVKEAIARWDQLNKHFRNIQRFEFVAPGGLGIRFDISMVRENAPNRRRARSFQEADVTGQPARYEAEVELTAPRDSLAADAATKLLVRGLSWLIQGRQRSYVLISNPTATGVLQDLGSIFASMQGKGRNRNPKMRFPGPQPVTLERVNMDTVPEPGVPNIRFMAGGYNVTDKADGLRCLLYVSRDGKIFLIDGGMRVYATGRAIAPDLAGTVLDGEWIRRDRENRIISHYYAFDILAHKGSIAVAQLPFTNPASVLAGKADTSRKAALEAVGATLKTASSPANVPSNQILQFGIKNFLAVNAGPTEIFRECAAVLESSKTALYNTDGLILTPNMEPLPLGGTWKSQFKWKPSQENTIDFLVVAEREENSKVEAVRPKFREDTGSTALCKTLRLFVGSRRDAAYADPRATVLGGGDLPAPPNTNDEYRPVEFHPIQPTDPMASICYMPIGEGANDPAGAAPAATALDTDTDTIRTRSGEIIQSNMIVEMAYHPERVPGFRWEPTRIRHDKTEHWHNKTGTAMNADWVANSIWSSIHNPVTEKMIMTGIVEECIASAESVAPKSAYYNRKAPARDMMKVQCLKNFHNEYIKRDILLRRTLPKGGSLCDLGMGKAGDLHKWCALGAGYVLGCDYVEDNLTNPEDGAYSRLLNKMVESGGRSAVAPMVFVQADAARPLKSGEAGATPMDSDLLKQEFAGRAAGGMDVVSCMFALHYMFRDEATLNGFLTNLADTVKVGGYFVGCCSDGDKIARKFGKETTIVGHDGATNVWAMTRRYGEASAVPTNSSGLGMAVDVNFISIGETHTEYLISWPYAMMKFQEVGLELLMPEELTAMGLPASTQMFEETWNMANAAGKNYGMTPAVREFSFTNRWFILRRRSVRRPEPFVAPPSVGRTAELTRPSVTMSLPPVAQATATAATAATTATKKTRTKKSQVGGNPKVSFDLIDL